METISKCCNIPLNVPLVTFVHVICYLNGSWCKCLSLKSPLCIWCCVCVVASLSRHSECWPRSTTATRWSAASKYPINTTWILLLCNVYINTLDYRQVIGIFWVHWSIWSLKDSRNIFSTKKHLFSCVFLLADWCSSSNFAGVMPVCTLVPLTVARRNVDTPTTFAPRRSWSRHFVWISFHCQLLK